ncbi:MAG TPA: methyltransferase domain-containing protein [Verrucomicrobiae bacterium]|nr:methyltransferase domain-containing protein [Verrucomicrobiae bacterium]
MQETQRSALYQSETSKHRSKLVSYCTGCGIDIGFGGDPITPNAVRVDFPTPYAYTGELGVQLAGDARDLRWFKDGALDFVYSSHVLEDFDEDETGPVLREWSRVLRPGGKLVLLQPDQQRYLAYCKKTGQGVNTHHSIDRFSLSYVRDVAGKIGGLHYLAGDENIDEYSFFAVFEKTAAANGSLAKVEDESGSLKLRQEKADLQFKLRTLEIEHKKLAEKLNHPVIKVLKVFYKLPGKFGKK